MVKPKLLIILVNVGSKLVQKITIIKTFLKLHQQLNSENKNKPLTVKQSKKVFYSLQTNETTVYDDIDHNVTENSFGVLRGPMSYISNISAPGGLSIDSLNIKKSYQYMKLVVSVFCVTTDQYLSFPSKNNFSY